MSPSTFCEDNLTAYRDASVVQWYAGRKTLWPAEVVLFDELKRDFQPNLSILDMGIGTGRTTSHLTGIATQYIGIDYSQEMIDAAKRIFPDQDLRVMDMRQMDQAFSPQSFDAVIVSFNGIDYLAHDDRCRLLQNIRNMLRPGGTLIFSSHSLDYGMAHRGFTVDVSVFAWNPLRLLVRCGRAAKRLLTWYPNYARNRKKEVFGSGYAILNDVAHEYRLLTYYVSTDAMTKQLRTAGFAGEISILDPHNPEVQGPIDKDHCWLYYRARRD